MSTERTDQYPEVSGEDAGTRAAAGRRKAEWPKKIRTLTANELDRLTIDGLGRFYWDGKLVNYEAHPSRIEQKPVDLDQHAMDLLDRTARELSDPNSRSAGREASSPSRPCETQPCDRRRRALAATPADQLAPAAAAAPAATARSGRRSAAPRGHGAPRRVRCRTPTRIRLTPAGSRSA